MYLLIQHELRIFGAGPDVPQRRLVRILSIDQIASCAPPIDWKCICAQQRAQISRLGFMPSMRSLNSEARHQENHAVIQVTLVRLVDSDGPELLVLTLHKRT